MNKQSQINKMAKDIGRFSQNIKKEQRKSLAEKLYNANYRRIPRLPKDTELSVGDIAELLTIVAMETQKETLEKFVEMLKRALVLKYGLDRLYCILSEATFDEICKEICEDILKRKV